MENQARRCSCKTAARRARHLDRRGRKSGAVLSPKLRPAKEATMTWFALIFTATLLAQEPATGDAIMLNQIMREPGMIRTSYIEKTLQRAGDGIAVSIARTQPRTALLDI